MPSTLPAEPSTFLHLLHVFKITMKSAFYLQLLSSYLKSEQHVIYRLKAGGAQGGPS